MTPDIPIKDLIESAMKAREKAYAPYSEFFVGAALLSADDRIYTGCNIENAAYGATNCAERTAIYKAVSEGKQKFQAIAIVGGTGGDVLQYCVPCGSCRQVMCEFAVPSDFYIIVAKNTVDYKIYTLDQLLPEAFTPSHLKV